MTGLLLDTHCWLWFVSGNARLPVAFRDRIAEGAGGRWLSPISVWEACVLNDRGRIKLALPFRAWLGEAMRRLPVREAPLTREVAILSRELALDTDDPADRFLAATAIVHKLDLVTVDRHLLEAPSVPTILVNP